MKRLRELVAIILASLVMLLGQSAHTMAGQTPSPQTATQTPTAHPWTMEQIVTSSAREAWALGGKTEEGFFEIVHALTELSAQKRGINLPDTHEAGTKTGNWIKKQVEKDPDQLLYVIVDRSVQYTAAHQSASAHQ